MRYNLHRSNDNAGPSPELWADCPLNELALEMGTGYFIRDDFLSLNQSATAGAADLLVDVSDDKATVTLLATEVGGVMRLGITGDDNEEVWVETCGGQGVLGKIDANEGALWFEARIRVSAITDNVCGIVVGLGEPKGVGNDVWQAEDTGALGSNDFVGFRTLQADGNGLDAVHYLAGGAEVVIENEAQVMVADTWYNVGIKFDGKTTITFYVDGVAVGTAEEDDDNFPDGEELCAVFAAKVGSDAALSLDVDWYQFAQLR